ncbi:unnamed protein product [Adineta ricciae]|uniref:Hint domain-containing protein n=1 Tax=Adineta ricciae TaxID=249248 RepID=A0A814NSJ2_ADIRI|nr:unnamed protein product [Adineta ricciae]
MASPTGSETPFLAAVPGLIPTQVLPEEPNLIQAQFITNDPGVMQTHILVHDSALMHTQVLMQDPVFKHTQILLRDPNFIETQNLMEAEEFVGSESEEPALTAAQPSCLIAALISLVVFSVCLALIPSLTSLYLPDKSVPVVRSNLSAYSNPWSLRYLTNFTVPAGYATRRKRANSPYDKSSLGRAFSQAMSFPANTIVVVVCSLNIGSGRRRRQQDTQTTSANVYMDVIVDVVPPARCQYSVHCQSNFRDEIVNKFQETQTFSLSANLTTGEALPVALKLIYLIEQGVTTPAPNETPAATTSPTTLTTTTDTTTAYAANGTTTLPLGATTGASSTTTLSATTVSTVPGTTTSTTTTAATTPTTSTTTTAATTSTTTTTTTTTCYYGKDKVQLIDGTQRSIEHLHIGDRIWTLTPPAQTPIQDEIILIMHNGTNLPALFYVFTTVNGNQVRITERHFIPVYDNKEQQVKVIRASFVQPEHYLLMNNKTFQETQTFSLSANLTTGEALPVALKLIYLIEQGVTTPSSTEASTTTTESTTIYSTTVPISTTTVTLAPGATTGSTVTGATTTTAKATTTTKCYYGKDKVQLIDGTQRSIEHLHIGDRIWTLTPPAQTPIQDEIILIMHNGTNLPALFYVFTTVNGNQQVKVIRASFVQPEHYLLMNNKTVPIRTISTQTGVGFYAPLTLSGYLTVNGISTAVFSDWYETSFETIQRVFLPVRVYYQLSRWMFGSDYNPICLPYKKLAMLTTFLETQEFEEPTFPPKRSTYIIAGVICLLLFSISLVLIPSLTSLYLPDKSVPVVRSNLSTYSNPWSLRYLTNFTVPAGYATRRKRAYSPYDKSSLGRAFSQAMSFSANTIVVVVCDLNIGSGRRRRQQ